MMNNDISDDEIEYKMAEKLSDTNMYRFATNYLEKEKDKDRRQLEKENQKNLKRQAKIQKYKIQEDKNKRLIEEASFSEMTWQQKVWVVFKVGLYAGKPLLVYMFLPAILIALSTAFVSRSFYNLSEAYSSTAQNYYTFIGIVATLIYLFVSARKRGSTVSKDITFSVNNVKWKYILLMVLFGIFTSIMISSVYTLLPDALMSNYDSHSTDVYKTENVHLLLFSMTILAPIGEEIIFRGYMLNRLLPVFKEKISVWIVTILFSLGHLSLFWTIYGIAMGWILAKISIRHDNILYSLAIHMGFNLPTLFNYLITSNESLNSIFFANKFLILIYGILSGTFAWLIFQYYNKEENLGIKFEFHKNR